MWDPGQALAYLTASSARWDVAENTGLSPANVPEMAQHPHQSVEAHQRMIHFNEITRWSGLARLADGRLPKLTIAAPFLAFIILHNEPLQPFLQLSENRHPSPLIEALALARFDIFYLGLVIIGMAVALFAIFSPAQITSQDDYDGFIEFKERTKTDNGVVGSLRLTLEEFKARTAHPDLSLDPKTSRRLFPRRFREGLGGIMRSLSGRSHSSGAEHASEQSSPETLLHALMDDAAGRNGTWDSIRLELQPHSIDVFRLEFIRADYASPATRALVFWLLIVGVIIAFIPTVITTYLVITDLFQVLASSGAQLEK